MAPLPHAIKTIIFPPFNRSLFSVTTSLGNLSLSTLLPPILLERIVSVLLGSINTAVLGQYSDDAVAAVGAINPLINMVLLLFSLISIGATVVISNFIGAERLSMVAQTNATALVFCSSFGVLFALLCIIFGEPIVDLMNLDGNIYEQAVLYFKIRMIGCPIVACSSILMAILRCHGHPRPTVAANLSSAVCNLALCILVVRHPAYSPITGVAGVASGTVISQLLSLAMAILFFHWVRIPVQLPAIRQFGSLLKKILKIGLPSGLSGGSYTLSQVITTSFVAMFSASSLAAKVYYTSILEYTYSFSISAGSANALLIGRLCGAGRYRHAHKLNRQLTRITISVNFCISLLLLLFRNQLLSLYTNDPAVFRQSFWIFFIDIIAELARAISQVYEYALRAAGDVTFTMVIVVLSCWGFGVGFAYILSIPCGMGLVGIWIALAIDETVRAAATVYRWHTGIWRIKGNTTTSKN